MREPNVSGPAQVALTARPVRAQLALDRGRLEAPDDRVVGVHVAVEPPDLAVGDDVQAGPLHVPDCGVGGIIQHLVEVELA